jgi:hypothetical protein
VVKCIDVGFPFSSGGAVELYQCIWVFCDPCIDVVHPLSDSVELCKLGLHHFMLFHDSSS